MPKTPASERDDDNLPEGMALFDVALTEIRDDMGYYCGVGDKAALSEAHAKSYREKGYIRPDLPDFGPKPDIKAMEDEIAALRARLASVDIPSVEVVEEPTNDEPSNSSEVSAGEDVSSKVKKPVKANRPKSRRRPALNS